MTTAAEPLTLDLFDPIPESGPYQEPLAPGALILRRFARDQLEELAMAVQQVLAQAPLRQLTTPGGYQMSVLNTSCGPVGWVSDNYGYRYARLNPETRQPWPAMPERFMQLAQSAAAQAGFAGFNPDSCLINRYDPGSRLSLHQDKSERNLQAPVVSLSLGLPAEFQFGGLERSNRTRQVWLYSGDVVVWGGPARLAYTASSRWPMAWTRCSGAAGSM